jgi:hypothetical protein
LAEFADGWKTREVTGGTTRDAVLALKDLVLNLAADGTGTWKLAGPVTKFTV